jgi:hypothetical protein
MPDSKDPHPTRSLSTKYEALYNRLLEHIGARWLEMPDKVCLHWPMWEPTYSGRLLIVGQALNGWMIDTPSVALGNATKRSSLIGATRAVSESDTAWTWMWPGPWSRPFWRLARAVMAHLGVNVNEIAWSNLAKVAPAGGGNPWGSLLGAQHELGGQLLRQEVRELDPEFVLVVSGRGYLEPFLVGAAMAPVWSRDGARQFDGLLDGRRWLVINHPGTFASRFDASLLAIRRALQA